jgi:valyl-tRNA synthetase
VTAPHWCWYQCVIVSLCQKAVTNASSALLLDVMKPVTKMCHAFMPYLPHRIFRKSEKAKSRILQLSIVAVVCRTPNSTDFLQIHGILW